MLHQLGEFEAWVERLSSWRPRPHPLQSHRGKSKLENSEDPSNRGGVEMTCALVRKLPERLWAVHERVMRVHFDVLTLIAVVTRSGPVESLDEQADRQR